MKTIYVIRHAKADGQPREALLTKQGEEQAEQLVDFFEDKQIDAIFSSPFTRALGTVQPLANRRGIKIIEDERLAERVLSSKENPDWKEMLRLSFEDFSLQFEGGETSQSGFERAASILAEAEEGPYHNIIFVTHGNLMTLLLRHIDDQFGIEELFALSNPDVYELTLKDNEKMWNRIWKN